MSKKKDPRSWPEILVGPYPGYYPQQRLFNYLSIEDLDPYDAPAHFLEMWAEEEHVDLDDREPFASSLESKELARFEEWLIKRDMGPKLVQEDPQFAPAYLTIKWPKITPRGRWAIHFTSKDPFDAFKKGATFQDLALSTWTKRKAEPECPKNLTQAPGDWDYIYVFAVDEDDFGKWGHYSDKYGTNAILFQTDAGVRAWHGGDEEYQLIVPACSEYNVIPIWNVNEGFRCRFRGEADEGLVFESPADLVAYIEKEEAKGARPLERLVCS